MEMTGDLKLDLNLNFDPEELALAAISSRDCGPVKRVVKPRQLYKLDGSDRKQASEINLLVQARPEGRYE
jgi:hypothetical protein